MNIKMTGENAVNKIYWDKDKILILTDQIETVEHRHYAMQLFLGIEENLSICVEDQMIECSCLLINKNVNHRFSTQNRLHISVIIQPTSDLSKPLYEIMGQSQYRIFDAEDRREVVKCGHDLLRNNNIETYRVFIQALYNYLGIVETERRYDDRIQALLYDIEHCNCDDHSISAFANKVLLSESRLSHLFSEQVGIPMKSYIQFHQLQKAFFVLLNGKSITEAAMAANFDTPSHFAAVVKRMMGMSARTSLKNSVFLKVYDT